MHIGITRVSVNFDVLPALSNINCILPEGQTTLMIGVTGAGKTTFCGYCMLICYLHKGQYF